jgi:hypothetical protein
MHAVSSLMFAALLALSSPGVAKALSPVSPETLGAQCEQGQDPALQPKRAETAVPAVVTGIDRQHGIVELETEAGRAQIMVAPEATRELQTGDEVTLCMTDEEPEHNLLQDSIVT